MRPKQHGGSGLPARAPLVMVTFHFFKAQKANLWFEGYLSHPPTQPNFCIILPVAAYLSSHLILGILPKGISKEGFKFRWRGPPSYNL